VKNEFAVNDNTGNCSAYSHGVLTEIQKLRLLSSLILSINVIFHLTEHWCKLLPISRIPKSKFSGISLSLTVSQTTGPLLYFQITQTTSLVTETSVCLHSLGI